jgi:hypothetical protein
MKPLEFQGSDRRLAAQSFIALGLVSLYLYFNLFTPLGLPMHVGSNDDKMFLGEAMRLLRGEKMYVDFFEFYLPGADVFYALVIRILGARAWIPNTCLLVLGTTFVWMSIIISRRLIPGYGAILPGLLFSGSFVSRVSRCRASLVQ